MKRSSLSKRSEQLCRNDETYEIGFVGISRMVSQLTPPSNGSTQRDDGVVVYYLIPDSLGRSQQTTG